MRARAAGAAIHLGLWLAAFGGLSALSRRPVLAAGGVLALQLVLLAVDAAKRRALREPLVYADIGLFSQALRYPRLYLPYLGLGGALAVAAAVTAAACAALLEVPLASVWPSLGACAFGCVIAALGTRWAGAPSLDPARDVAAYGLLASLWLYRVAEWRAAPSIAFPFLAQGPAGDAARPHVVVLEIESFFDARRLGADIPRPLLAHFDALGAEGRSGRLRVPAWGAYTMRSEFAFLSGVANRDLGVYRFNPYRYALRRAVPTVASLLRARGYRTVCVHPHPAGFFRRDRVFPNLGFDAFIDIEGFAGEARDGPYISDAAVGRRVIRTLAEASAPVFVFAITMENHGPFHLEGRDELAVYLRHLGNADALIGTLAQVLREAGSGVLCAYGDHLPSLPAVYAARAFDDPRTDYLLWSAGMREGRRRDQAVEALAGDLLSRV
jgi:hypothetical protein